MKKIKQDMVSKHNTTVDILQVDNDLFITFLGSVVSMSHKVTQSDCHPAWILTSYIKGYHCRHVVKTIATEIPQV